MRAACDVVGEGARARRRARHARVPPAATPLGADRPPAARRSPNAAELVVIAGLTGVAKADAEVVGRHRAARRPARRRRPARSSRASGTAVCSTSDADDEVRVDRARHRRRDARRRAARAHGGRARQHRAVRAAAARPPRARGDRAQRRVGAHARRLGARPGAAAPARAARPRLPPRRRVRAARRRARARRARQRRCPAVAWERISRDAGVVGGSASGRRASSTTRRTLVGRRRRAVGPAPSASRARRASLAALRRGARRRSRPRAEHVVGARASGRTGSSPAGSAAKRRARELVAVRAGSGAPRRRRARPARRTSTRSRPRPTLEVFRRSLALELDAARDRVGRLGEGVLVGPAALALGVELDRVWVCGLAEGVFPAPPRDDPLLADADRARARRRAAAARATASPTTSARCSRRSRARPGARTLCFPRGDLRRNTEHVPSRFLLDTIEALVGRARARRPTSPRRAWCTIVPVVRARAHARARSRRPGTSSTCAPRSRGEPRIAAVPAVARGLELARARRSADVHPLRRQPLAPRRARSRRRARRRRASGVGDPARDVGEVPARVLRELPAARAARSSGPRRSCSSRRSTGATSCTRRSTASCTELIGDAGCRPPVVRRAPRRACTRSCARRATRSRRAGSAAGACCGRAPAASCTPSSTRSSTPTATTAPRTAPTRSRPSSRSAARGSGHPAIEIASPTAAACASAARSTASTAAPTASSPSSTTRAARPTAYDELSHDDPLLGGHAAAAPDLRARGADACSVDGAPRADRRVVLVRAARAEEAARLRRRRRRSRRRSIDALRAIVDGIDAGRVPAAAARARASQIFTECDYCDPDGLGTTDRIARGCASARARARRLPRAHRRPAPTNERTDSPTRRRARRCASRLDETLFVEAGAGTGKTTVLVDRIVALVTADGPDLPVPMRSVAAITFTEKAAAELRDRVRGELEERCARRADRRRACAQRCVDALDELDDAAICTLHSFAQRILTAFPIEAGLPPRIEVHDEVSSLLVVRRALAAHSRRPARRSRARAGGARPARRAAPALDHLRRVAEFLDDNWDLLDRIDAAAAAARRSTSTRVARRARRRVRDGRRLHRRRRQAARAARASSPSTATGCAPRSTTPRASSCCSPRSRRSRCGIGQQGELARHRRRCATAIVRARRAARRRSSRRGHRRRAAPRRRVPRARARPSTRPTRRRAGELEFHDLLVLARSLLRDPEHGPAVRAPAARALPAAPDRRVPGHRSDPGRDRGAARRVRRPTPTARDWQRASTSTPGRLFFVGDPKQSIYRFRRADIATFLAARDRFADGAAPAHVATSARPRRCSRGSTTCSAELIQPVAGLAARVLRARAPARRGAGRSGRAAARRRAARRPDSDGRRAARARGRERRGRGARRDRRALAGRRRQRRVARRPPRRRLHPAAGAHVAALPRARARRRRHLVPRRDELARLRTREVRDLLMTLRAIDDPSDELALVSALRSSLFGCGDDDLFEFHVEHGGRWDVRRPPPDDAARTTIRSPTRCGSSRALHDDAHVGDAERAARAHRARAARARGRRRRRPLPRRRAARALRRRPGARVRRRGRRLAARLPRVGDAAGHRRARGSSRPCCPRPTTTRCGS